jgi:hypothetical protein
MDRTTKDTQIGRIKEKFSKMSSAVFLDYWSVLHFNLFSNSKWTRSKTFFTEVLTRIWFMSWTWTRAGLSSSLFSPSRGKKRASGTVLVKALVQKKH